MAEAPVRLGEAARRLVKEFEAYGISGRSYPQQMLAKFDGRRCIVAASGWTLWDDIGSLGITSLRSDGRYGWDVLCVNDVIMHWPGVVDHAYSNQHRWLDAWTGGRRETIGQIVTRQEWGGVGATHSNIAGGQYQWPWPGHGTSTLNAVYTAIALGYDPIVICGAPLDNGHHYFEPPWVKCNFERGVGQNKRGELMYWTNAQRKVFGGRVFAQSGRTRELLGAYS